MSYYLSVFVNRREIKTLWLISAVLHIIVWVSVFMMFSYQGVLIGLLFSVFALNKAIESYKGPLHLPIINAFTSYSIRLFIVFLISIAIMHFAF